MKNKTRKGILAVMCLALAVIPCFAFGGRVEIIALSGDVEILPAGKTDWVSAGVTMVLRRGDRIKTGRASSCNLAFDRRARNVVGINESSDVVILLKGREKIESSFSYRGCRMRIEPKT